MLERTIRAHLMIRVEDETGIRVTSWETTYETADDGTPEGFAKAYDRAIRQVDRESTRLAAAASDNLDDRAATNAAEIDENDEAKPEPELDDASPFTGAGNGEAVPLLDLDLDDDKGDGPEVVEPELVEDDDEPDDYEDDEARGHEEPRPDDRDRYDLNELI